VSLPQNVCLPLNPQVIGVPTLPRISLEASCTSNPWVGLPSSLQNLIPSFNASFEAWNFDRFQDSKPLGFFVQFHTNTNPREFSGCLVTQGFIPLGFRKRV